MTINIPQIRNVSPDIFIRQPWVNRVNEDIHIPIDLDMSRMTDNNRIYSPYIPLMVSTPSGENHWYSEYLQRGMYPGQESVAKDYRDFLPMFEFYWNKFITENIPRMVVYAPRRSGKTRFLLSLMDKNPTYKLGAMNERNRMDLIRNIETTTDIRDRIFNSYDGDGTNWYRGLRSDNIFLFDENCPHMRSIYDKRAFILVTPNGSRDQLYSKDCAMTVDMLRDYQEDLEQSRIIRCFLPEELFNIT